MSGRQPTYAEKLKDPRWQRKRLDILNRDEWSCQACGDKDATLHVHHKEYKFGKDPWEYGEGDLITYCADCHETAGEIANDIKHLTGRMSLEQQSELVGLVQELIQMRYGTGLVLLSEFVRQAHAVQLKDRKEEQSRSGSKSLPQ